MFVQLKSTQEGAIPQIVEVPTLLAARDTVLNYLKAYEVQAGNWAGGEVYADYADVGQEGKEIAWVSYNGRVWQHLPGDGHHINPEIKLLEKVRVVVEAAHGLGYVAEAPDWIQVEIVGVDEDAHETW